MPVSFTTLPSGAARPHRRHARSYPAGVSARGPSFCGGSPPTMFPRALAAHAADLKVSVFDLTPSPDIIGQSDSIHVVALEIPHQPALRADEVVMDLDVPVKTQAVRGHLHPGDQPSVFQSVKNAVHRVQRDFGNALAHPPKNEIRIGMPVRAGHFTEDLRALRGDSRALDACRIPGTAQGAHRAVVGWVSLRTPPNTSESYLRM